MRRLLFVGCFAVLLTCTTALPVSAQSSVGFADPDDISNLLDYRLPKWTYHIWDANFGLGGSGSDISQAGASQISNRFSTNLGTDYSYNRESEQKILSFGGNLAGRYQHAHTGQGDHENSGHNLFGGLGINGSIKQYLGEGPFSVLAGLSTGRNYSEDSNSTTTGGVSNEVSHYYRYSNQRYNVGIGVGRLRNVVPLIRAQRLSERLAALGRSRLAFWQVQKVAGILAQEYGYRRVFDRSDRHFWSEVIEPMLSDATPLTPYEIFYLTDVLNEDVGLRRQGWQLSAQFAYEDGSSTGSDLDYNTRRRAPTLNLAWYHNFTLNTQVYLDAIWRYSIDNMNERETEYGSLDLRLGHLWNITDRYILRNELRGSGDSSINDDHRARRARYSLILSTYIEDQLSLESEVSANYNWRRNGDQIQDGWSWQYRIFLQYHLDRSLF